MPKFTITKTARTFAMLSMLILLMVFSVMLTILQTHQRILYVCPRQSLKLFQKILGYNGEKWNFLMFSLWFGWKICKNKNWIGLFGMKKNVDGSAFEIDQYYSDTFYMVSDEFFIIQFRKLLNYLVEHL